MERCVVFVQYNPAVCSKLLGSLIVMEFAKVREIYFVPLLPWK